MPSFYHLLRKVPLPHGAGVQTQSLPVYVDLKAVSKNVWMLQTKKSYSQTNNLAEISLPDGGLRNLRSVCAVLHAHRVEGNVTAHSTV